LGFHECRFLAAAILGFRKPEVCEAQCSDKLFQITKPQHKTCWLERGER